jgi:hypothetical protein
MKKRQPLLLIVFFATLMPFAYGQSGKTNQIAESLIVCEVLKQSLDTETVKYLFHSNKLVLENQVESMEERLKLRYAEINLIEIEFSTQQVILILPKNNSIDLLETILNRFNCFEYLIVSEN